MPSHQERIREKSALPPDYRFGDAGRGAGHAHQFSAVSGYCRMCGLQYLPYLAEAFPAGGWCGARTENRLFVTKLPEGATMFDFVAGLDPDDTRVTARPR